MVKKLLLSDIWSKYKKNKPSTLLEDVNNSITIEYCYLNQFDWEKYLVTYPDLKTQFKDADEFTIYKHWIEIGKNENRCAGKKYSQEPFEKFDSSSYLENNSDLHLLTSHLELYKHWCENGIHENRCVTKVETINESSDTVEEITI